MTALLDTCALLWWWNDPDKLSKRVLSLIKDPQNSFYVSAATAWEVSTKYRIGKYPNGANIIADWEKRLLEDGFRELTISISHALKAGTLPGDHKDPFDRMIASQSLITAYPVVTSDYQIGNLGAEVIW
jgi:PIN domain nuclease of toxin-antitoxin system